MSRPWILGIISCLIFASSTLVGWSQEYLDLPDEPAGQASSLADRFSSFTDKFRRKTKPSTQPTSSGENRSRPTTPRYRNVSLQDQQRARRVSRQRLEEQQPAPVTNQSNQPSRPTKTAAQVRTKAPTPKTRPKTSGIVARPNTNDLLPDTALFSRSRTSRSSQQSRSQPLAKTTAPNVEKLRSATTLPRAGTSDKKTASPRVARLSPTTSRANELDAALADLLKAQPEAPKKKVAKAPSLKSSANSTSQKVDVPNNGAFDLRQALLEDEGEAIASEAEQAKKKPIREQVAAKPATPTAKAVEKEAVQSPVEKALRSAPTLTNTPIVVAETNPEPQVVVPAKPEIQPPLVLQPTVSKPVVSKSVPPQPIIVAVPPKQAITIATPRPSPTVASSAPRNFGSDPFESTRNQSVGTTSSSANPMRPFQAVIEQEAPTETFSRPKNGVLQSTQQPVIVSQVEGPRSILVGREATYQVTLENTSSTGASHISAEITVPEWAELLDAMSTSGVVERSSDGVTSGALVWKISELKPRSSQALRLRLIPRSGRPLQLGVRWTQAPVQTQAIVEVQEPKLELAISGPQEVRFGKPQRYRLTLSNPGTGTTELVALRLVPPGGDAQSAVTQEIGRLKAGEVKDIDLELTAREAGELLIQADASSVGGLKAETTKSVLCLKPELEVDWRGPDKKYAGTVAAYYFRVSNPGTAATEPVDMSVKLPAGAEFVTASEGFSINTATGVVSWSLASLDASEEQFMQLRCKIARPGTNDFLLSATTHDSELKDSKAFQTDVVALADLKLEVSDPQGPLPMGEEVVYEIRVRNRGTTGAEHINIVGLFSEGIDPTTVEGAQYSMRDGRVSFHPIKSLPAGREIQLRIHAKATQVGTHIFRTEVTCPKLDIKLAAEETTRFFEDEHRWENGKTPYMAEREATTQR